MLGINLIIGCVPEVHTFKSVGEKFAVRPVKGNNSNVFLDAYVNDKGLTLCCKLKYIQPTLTSGQIQGQNLAQKLWAHYLKGLSTGVTIRAGEKEFKVDQSVLECQSEYFAAMLSSNLSEAQSGHVDIEDFDAATVEAFIKWIYLGEIDNKTSTDKLLIFADKYLLYELKKQCVEMMIQNLSDLNVFPALACSIQCKSDHLKDAAVDYLANKERTEQMMLFASNEWIEFVYEHGAEAKEIVATLCKKTDF
ncbi:Speckle-type POZ protein B [Aphelenchoides bicaudatus]|nr:Speckle-type POZ protein B [Aphelenchoides bicaudatus]